jgi:cytochrome c oxidase subunit 2
MLAALAAAIVLATCSSGPNQHPTGDAAPPNIFPGQVVTQQGQQSAELYPIIFGIAVAIFILVEGLIIVIAIRFRRKPGQTELPPQTHGSNVLEIAWTLIPAIVVTVIFVLSMGVLVNANADTADPAVTVDVTGFQWQWQFTYPDLKNTQGQPLSYTGAGKDGPVMVLPVGPTVRIRLHSKDVIHSFYVPQFFRKLDVVPGRTNEFEVNIKDVGIFGGQCAEFCGLSHNEMYFTVDARSTADFQAWAKAEQAKASVTPPPAPGSGGPPPASGGAGTLQVASVSVSAGFDPNTLTAPANQPLTVQFTNRDTAAPHNFAIHRANADGTDWIGQPIANAGQSATYQVPPLKPGTYQFFCAVHPVMTGTITVGP